MYSVQLNGQLKYTAGPSAKNECLAIDPDGMVYKLKTIHDRPTRFVAIPQKNAAGQHMHCNELLSHDGIVTLNPYLPR